jgi:hypothetical protein
MPPLAIISVKHPRLILAIRQGTAQFSGVKVDVVPILDDVELAAVADSQRCDCLRAAGENIR